MDRGPAIWPAMLSSAEPSGVAERAASSKGGSGLLRFSGQQPNPGRVRPGCCARSSTSSRASLFWPRASGQRCACCTGALEQSGLRAWGLRVCSVGGMGALALIARVVIELGSALPIVPQPIGPPSTCVRARARAHAPYAVHSAAAPRRADRSGATMLAALDPPSGRGYGRPLRPPRHPDCRGAGLRWPCGRGGHAGRAGHGGDCSLAVCGQGQGQAQGQGGAGAVVVNWIDRWRWSAWGAWVCTGVG